MSSLSFEKINPFIKSDSRKHLLIHYIRNQFFVAFFFETNSFSPLHLNYAFLTQRVVCHVPSLISLCRPLIVLPNPWRLCFLCNVWNPTSNNSSNRRNCPRQKFEFFNCLNIILLTSTNNTGIPSCKYKWMLTCNRTVLWYVVMSHLPLNSPTPP